VEQTDRAIRLLDFRRFTTIQVWVDESPQSLSRRTLVDENVRRAMQGCDDLFTLLLTTQTSRSFFISDDLYRDNSLIYRIYRDNNIAIRFRVGNGRIESYHFNHSDDSFELRLLRARNRYRL